MPKSSKLTAFLTMLPLTAFAANDWSKPCLYGECAYDVPASEKSITANLFISGSSNAISDITPAAGWEILNCSSNASTQDIRLICSGDEASCVHVFQNGAEHTVVRLPEGCGRSPFAHVIKAWVSDDQTVPEYVSSRISRRDGTMPAVHTFSLDSDFTQASSSRHGNVSLVIYGSTMPGAFSNTSAISLSSRLRSRNAGSEVVDSVVSSAFNSFSESLSFITSFQRNSTLNSIPIDLDQPFNVFNETLLCSKDAESKLSVDIDAKMTGLVNLGVIAEGTIIPPQITDFGIFASMTGDLDGTLSFSSNVDGELDSGQIPLFTAGLPGLSIPDILTLGPALALKAEATASIDIDMDFSVNLAYSVDNLSLFFPPSLTRSSNATISPKDTPLTLSVSPGVESNATLAAHIIPSFEIGIEAFDLTASIFLDFDTSASLDLGLEASASENVNTTRATSPSGEIDGCVDVKGGISVTAGLEGKIPFFDLFDDSLSITLFSKDFDFFQECFPNSTDAMTTTLSLSDSMTATSSNLFSTTAITESFTMNAPSSVENTAMIDPSCPTAASSLPEFLPIALRKRIHPSLGILSKRAFTCPVNDITSVNTLVNKTLSSSGFVP